MRVRWSVAVASGGLLGLAGIAGVQRARSVTRRPPQSLAPSATATLAAASTPVGSSAAARTSAAARGTAAPVAPAAADACPADMVLVEGEFCPVLRYVCGDWTDENEYRCAEYRRGQPCLDRPDRRRYCIDRHEWPNRVGANPKVYVNWNEAKEMCGRVGKRLCRRSEWVLACEGPKRLPYPWGFKRQPSPCNVDRTPVPFDALALERSSSREEELARLWQADPIGSHPDCVSAFGVHDMSGNVDEWTDNRADNPHTKRPSTLNGGYWGPVRDTCRLTTKSHGPNFRFYQVGFRCCSDTRDGVPVPAPRPWVEPEKPYRAYR